MGTYKLLLDNDLDYDFDLIAIHCSLEVYRLAYMINKNLKLQLRRCRTDIPLYYKGVDHSLPLYECDREDQSAVIQLLSNQYRVRVQTAEKGLFGQEKAVQTIHLLSELPRVDYFLKIENSGYAFAKANLLSTLNAIPQIITAYSIDPNQLKHKEHLIFE